jgi:hypothetical protein
VQYEIGRREEAEVSGRCLVQVGIDSFAHERSYFGVISAYALGGIRYDTGGCYDRKRGLAFGLKRKEAAR